MVKPCNVTSHTVARIEYADHGPIAQTGRLYAEYVINYIYYPFPGLEDHPIDALEVAGAGCLIPWFGLENEAKTMPKPWFWGSKTAIFEPVPEGIPGSRKGWKTAFSRFT